MDYSGGALSYEGMELLRNVERVAFGRAKNDFLLQFFLVDIFTTMHEN